MSLTIFAFEARTDILDSDLLEDFVGGFRLIEDSLYLFMLVFALN